MAEEGALTLYTTDDTGNYVEYTPPAPPSFTETLPEDLRGNEHLEGVEDGATLARYYVDLKKDYLRPPESPEGYDFEKPEGFMASDDEVNQFRKIAHEEGLNQKQFDRMISLSVDVQNSAKTALEKAINDRHEAFKAELKTEWGDNYEKNVEAARSVLNHEKIADNGFKQFLEDTRFGDHPQVVKLFSKLSSLLSEDAFMKPGTGDDAPSQPRTEDGRPMLNFPSMKA